MKNFIWGSRLLLAHTLPSPAIALILMVSDSSKCSSHCKCIPGKKADEKDNFKGISPKLPKHICFCAGLAPWACNQYSYMRPVGLGLVLYSHHLDFLKFMFEFVLCKWSSNGNGECPLSASSYFPRTMSPQLAPLPQYPGPSQLPHRLFHLASVAALCAQLQWPVHPWRTGVRWNVPRQLGAGPGYCGPYPEVPVSERTKQDSLGT